MNNKEVIGKLIEYYLTQDPKMIARVLANCMVDFNRLTHYQGLSPDELERLEGRLKFNDEALRKFAKDEKHEDLKLFIFKEDGTTEFQEK